MFKYLLLILLCLIFIGSEVSAGYMNSFESVSAEYKPEVDKIHLLQLGSGVVNVVDFGGELVLSKEKYCDGNGAYFELPVEYDRGFSAVVLEADVYNYDSFSGYNEASVILADDSNRGYAVGYVIIDRSPEMWVSYRPGGSSLSKDSHLATISIDNLRDKWVHTKLILYPNGYIKGIVYDYQSGKSWSVVVLDSRVNKFSRIVILDGNDFRVRNIKVYYDFDEVSPYSIVEPDFYMEIPNDADFEEAYDSTYGWNDYVSVTTLGDGFPAIYKHTKPDPRGGSYILPMTLDRSKYNIVIEADVMKPSTVHYNGLRFGLEDSNWNGYSVYLELGSGRIGYDFRVEGVATKHYNSGVFTYSKGTWVHVRMVLYSSGSLYVELSMNGATYTYSATDNTYSLFDRVVIRGGYPFYYRNIRVYTTTEDPLSVTIQQDVTYPSHVFRLIKLGSVEVK